MLETLWFPLLKSGTCLLGLDLKLFLVVEHAQRIMFLFNMFL